MIRREWLKHVGVSPLLLAGGAVPARAEESTIDYVETVADLRAYAGSASSLVVGGYARPGDGGGGLFHRLAAQRLDVDDGTVFAARDGGSWLRDGPEDIDVRWYGASSDADATRAIQSAIDACIRQRRRLWLSPGIYPTSRTSAYTQAYNKKIRHYALKINGPIDIYGPGTLFLSGNVAVAGAHAILVSDTQDVHISDITIESEFRGAFEAERYHAVGIAFERCRGCGASEVTVRDMGAGIHAYLSDAIEIIRCRSVTKSAAITRRGSHIALYATSNSSIQECRTSGGTHDGDLGVFGARSSGNRILGNHCVAWLEGDESESAPFLSAQGIFIDSGQADVLVANNRVDGYFYGIDVKTEVGGVFGRDNTVTRCFVGIAVRMGENPQPSESVFVQGNIIEPNGGNATVEDARQYWNTYDSVGILVGGAAIQRVMIRENIIRTAPYFNAPARIDSAGRLKVNPGIERFALPTSVATLPSPNNFSADRAAQPNFLPDNAPRSGRVRVLVSRFRFVGVLVDASTGDAEQTLDISDNDIALVTVMPQLGIEHISAGPAVVVRGNSQTRIVLTRNIVRRSAKFDTASPLARIDAILIAEVADNEFTAEDGVEPLISCSKCGSVGFHRNRLAGGGFAFNMLDVNKIFAFDNYYTGISSKAFRSDNFKFIKLDRNIVECNDLINFCEIISIYESICVISNNISTSELDISWGKIDENNIKLIIINNINANPH